jgi:ribonuclease P protein component
VFNSPFFSYRKFILPDHNGNKGPRFSCVISKKVAPKSVDRNLLKRRIMAIVGQIIKNHPQSKYSVIIYPKKTAISLKYLEIESELKSAGVLF